MFQRSSGCTAARRDSYRLRVEAVFETVAFEPSGRSRPAPGWHAPSEQPDPEDGFSGRNGGLDAVLAKGRRRPRSSQSSAVRALARAAQTSRAEPRRSPDELSPPQILERGSGRNRSKPTRKPQTREPCVGLLRLRWGVARKKKTSAYL